MNSQPKPKYELGDWFRYENSIYLIVMRYDDVDSPGLYSYSLLPSVGERKAVDGFGVLAVAESKIDQHMELVEDEEKLIQEIEAGLYNHQLSSE